MQYPTEDKSTPEVIISVFYPTGVAVDPTHDHLYWGALYNQIYRSNLDGTETIMIVNNVHLPVDIDLDINNR